MTDAKPKHTADRAPMVVLTPADVAKLMQCTRRRAFQYSRERFERWVNETNFQPPPVVRGIGRRGADTYPLARNAAQQPSRENVLQIRPTQPRKRKVPKS